MVLPLMRVMEASMRANILALDVLYPEVCKLCELKIISHQASHVDNLFDLKRARMKREEATMYYVENFMS